MRIFVLIIAQVTIQIHFGKWEIVVIIIYHLRRGLKLYQDIDILAMPVVNTTILHLPKAVF